jgi:hypothetical protein
MADAMKGVTKALASMNKSIGKLNKVPSYHKSIRL